MRYISAVSYLCNVCFRCVPYPRVCHHAAQHRPAWTGRYCTLNVEDLQVLPPPLTTNNFKPVITYFCHQRSSAMSQLTKHVILKKIFNFSHHPVFNKHICICCSNLFHQSDISLACLVPRYLSPYVLKLNFACHLIFSSYQFCVKIYVISR